MARKVDPEILRGFIDEAQGYLPQIRQGIAALVEDGSRFEVLEEIHRLCHSIKGAASMVGLSVLGHMAYYLEESIEQIGAGQLAIDDRTAETLLHGLDVLDRYLDRCVDEGFDPRPLASELVSRFRRLRDQPESGDADELERILPDEPAAAPLPFPDDLPGVDGPGAGDGFEVEGPPTGAPAFVEEPAPEEPDFEDVVSPELLEAFLQEAHDHMQVIHRGLQGLEATPDDRELMQEVRRPVHTLKGAASMVGLTRIGNLAHRMEDLLDQLYEGSKSLSPDTLELLLATGDALEDMVGRDNPNRPSAASLTPLYERYAELLDGAGGDAPQPLEPLGEGPVVDLSDLGSAPAPSTPEPQTRRPSQIVRVPIERLDELVRLVSELVVSRSTFERHFGELGRQTQELDLSSDRLRGIAGRMDSEYEVLALSGGTPSASTKTAAVERTPDFDDLELDRYTEFHLLSRALAETSIDVSSLRGQLGGTLVDFDAYLSRMGRLTSEIQDKLMRLRMVPMASLVSRFRRAVRVVARQRDKHVDLVVEGEDTELDKTVLEDIADPLLHLLRNAVDHGIEPSSLRQAKGKPARGTITLRSYYEGTNVVISISDDGAGLDLERLRRVAVDQGYLSETEAEHMADGQLHALAFLPGFSTATQVSEISGRGVGLDVVKEHVNRMKGVLRVQSTTDEGTTFTVHLPMTLAITRVLLVRVRGALYAIPLAGVTQILRLEHDSLEILGTETVMRLDDRVYPVTHLGDALGLPTPTATDDDIRRRRPVLILSTGGQEHAVVVDRIVEAREVVVKTLGNLLTHVHGVTGATLLGDGSVVLILNPLDLLGEESAGHSVATMAVPTAPAQGESPRRALDVMIVDDSVSVRRVLTNLAKSAGWNPITARDGLEALEMLQRSASPPDILLLDIEMPRMDGYELTSALRAQKPWQDLPIVIITSRAGQKHRQRAFDLGATEYLVKPYQDETLLAVVRRLVREARDRGAP